MEFVNVYFAGPVKLFIYDCQCVCVFSLYTYGGHEIMEPYFSLYMEGNLFWPNRRFELGMPADSCMPAIEPIKI